MRRQFLSMSILLATLLALIQPALADLDTRKLTNLLEISIHGEIAPADADALAKAENQLAYAPLIRVKLNSAGGDIDAAYKIGRMLRKHDARTEIPKGATCASACSLIFIAGVHRVAEGALGVHRPYRVSPSTSRDAVQQQTVSLQRGLREYISEMGISTAFFDETVRVPPEEMKLFQGSQEIQRLVPQVDAVWDEIVVSYLARRYGITTDEVRRRRAQEGRCASRFGDDRRDCVEATRWGLSEATYKLRKVGLSKCVLTREESDTLSRIPTHERRDHAYWLRLEACHRQALLV